MSKILVLLASSALLISTSLLAQSHHQHGTAEAAPDGPPLILGVLDFPNSGAPAAQEAFTRGVLLLHSFEYDDARAAFLEAQHLDPGFAMAIWGEAMTLNHPLWSRQDRTEALAVLAKLPEEPAATPREQMFLDALDALYDRKGAPAKEKPERDLAYRESMKAIAAAYPNDLEAASFYALSILGSVYERDFRTYMLAASVLEEVFATQPRHPGAAHYLIHSYDDPVHAPLGLRAARVYATIAPSASHAQHMVSHIYTSLGRWDEVVDANRNAVRVSEEALQRAGKPVANRSKHALLWLEYALLQQGLRNEARETLRVMAEDHAASPTPNSAMHCVLMRASYVVDDATGELPLEPINSSTQSLHFRAVEAFATAFRALSLGDEATAQVTLAALQQAVSDAHVLTAAQGLHEHEGATSPDDYLVATIITRELEALLHYRAGRVDEAIALLTTAAADENTRALEYGPPTVPKPANELLGEMLLAQGRAAEAAAQFEAALERNTRRTRALVGLYRAKTATGDETGAAGARSLLEDGWRGQAGAWQTFETPWLSSHVPVSETAQR